MAVTINGTTGITTTGDYDAEDNDKILLGTGDDLQIYHNGSHSYIDNTTGTLHLRDDSVIHFASTTNEDLAKFTANGAVELYYDNVKSFATQTNGIAAYGSEGNDAYIYLFADEADDLADQWRIRGWQASQTLSIEYRNSSGTYENSFLCNGDGNTKLFYNNVEKLETKNEGILVSGTVQANYGSGAYGSQINHDQTTGTHIQFQRQGYNNGNITHDNNNSAYNTSGSDRTLKKNFEDWTDSYWTAFKNLSPQKFHFLTDADSDPKCRGYIAQDLVTTFPEAYPKEVVSDKYMFNPSGMVPYLMKTLKEALIEIDTLKTKVAALEAA